MLATIITVFALSRCSIAKAVFAHYMVGGMTSAEASQDIADAMAVGFDGFALNTHTTSSNDSWNIDAINDLLNAAQGTNFKMFLSFDMSWALDVAQLGPFLTQFSNHSQYYKTDDGRPWVSTYNGGSINSETWYDSFIQPLIAEGVTPYFVPDFDDWSGYPAGFFEAFSSVVDGAFSWESAWPSPGTTPSNVSDTVDQNLIEQAHAAGKIYMMPLSTFQFKNLGSGQDWYRIGETNLPERMVQILDLQPDFVEVLTWNDAGESHYIGNIWPEQIANTNIGGYANGFDHTGWQQVLKPFIAAYKGGAAHVSFMASESGKPEGAMWYRTLLTSASCSSSLSNYQQARDALNFAVVLPASSGGAYQIEVYSDNQLIRTVDGVEGLNYESISGLQAGAGQYIQIVDGQGIVVALANGTKDVLSESSDSSLCNWNYEVVGLSQLH